MSDCIFCKISNKEQLADIVYENEDIVAFKDINPKAPIHILVVPKKHIATVNDIVQEDGKLMGSMILEAKNVAKNQGIDEGYKLVFNVGSKGGQVIYHIHLHLMGGWS